jgi:hypothetical protein
MKRFPEDFMFVLTKEEWVILRTQIVTSSWGGTRYQPFAFTEQGVAMLSGLLNSDVAIAANIRIMRAFVAVRQFLLNPSIDEVQELRIEMKSEMQVLREYLEDVFSDYNDINEDTRTQLALIGEALAKLEVKHKYINQPRKRIGFIRDGEDIKSNSD